MKYSSEEERKQALKEQKRKWMNKKYHEDEEFREKIKQRNKERYQRICELANKMKEMEKQQIEKEIIQAVDNCEETE